MVPQTLSAGIAFLILIAPGLVHELLRSRRKLMANESTFREISRIALTSLFYSCASVAIILLLRFQFAENIVDPRQAVQVGSVYLRDNYVVAAGTLAAELVFSCALALLWHLVSGNSGQSKASLGAKSLWFEDFRENCPVGSRPWVHVQLLDGTSFYGFVRSSSADGKFSDRELSIEGAFMAREDPASGADSDDDEPVVIGDDWESVIIRGAEIRYIAVQYIDRHDGSPSHSARYDSELEQESRIQQQLSTDNQEARSVAVVNP